MLTVRHSVCVGPSARSGGRAPELQWATAAALGPGAVCVAGVGGHVIGEGSGHIYIYMYIYIYICLYSPVYRLTLNT